MPARRGRRTKIEGQFAPRTIAMLRSPAMAALSLSGRRILDRLEIELGDHGGAENGRLPCTFDDFERFGIDRHAIGPALRECAALGFIECTERGTAGNAEFRRASLFRLTYRHTDHAAPTDDWKRFTTSEQATLRARGAREKPDEQKRRAARRKQNPSGGKPTGSSGGNPHRKPKFPSGGNPHYRASGETPTTLDISGGGPISTNSGRCPVGRKRAELAAAEAGSITKEEDR
jgi:hypothetical protein